MRAHVRRIPAAVVMPGRTLQTSMLVNDEFAQDLIDTPTMLLSHARAQLDKLPARRVPMKIVHGEVRAAPGYDPYQRGFVRYRIITRIERVEVVA